MSTPEVRTSGAASAGVAPVVMRVAATVSPELDWSGSMGEVYFAQSTVTPDGTVTA